MKRFSTIERLLTAPDMQRQLIIYGVGWSGKVLYEFLKEKGKQIMMFAVTSQRSNVEQDGIPVRYIDNILTQYQSTEFSIILAALKPNRHAMKQELEKRNIKDYIEIEDILLYEMNMENRKAYAREKEYKHARQKSDLRKTVGYVSPGYLDTDYAEQRLIINKIEGIHYVMLPKETVDVHTICSRKDADFDTYRSLSEACYCPSEYTPRADLIHTFNMVCDTDNSWCASFETVIPRVWANTEEERQYCLRLAELLKRPNCKALYALCKNAYEIQRDHLRNMMLSSVDVELLMNKTKVLHPPQKILISEDRLIEKHKTKKIHFIFIGKAFFIKGGREVIEVLSEFEEEYEFKLTLISALQYGDYFTKTPYEEMLRCKEMIKSKDWIAYYEYLPNEDVLEKCREATVGLFPSIADTYGYVVLEMQAAGCPVVTTNARAFPEINNEECGWVCRLPVDSLGCCTEHKTEVWSAILKRELRKCIQDMFDHPETIPQKGRKALDRIRTMHDPYEYQKELRKNLT